MATVGPDGDDATAALAPVEMERGALATFDALFDAHYARAVRLAWMLSPGAGSAAEDAAADAIAKVWPRWAKGQVEEFWPYLRVAVCNEVRMRGRRLSLARRAAPTRERADERAFDAGVVDRAVLAGALRALPPRQRAAIVLRFYEDLSEAETARLMRCSVGTVKSTTARALDALREQMKDAR